MNELRDLQIEANIIAYELLQYNDKDKLKRLIEINDRREFLLRQRNGDSSLPKLEFPQPQHRGGTTY